MQNTQNNTRINIYLQKYSFSLITKDFHPVGFSSQDVSRLRSRRQRIDRCDPVEELRKAKKTYEFSMDHVAIWNSAEGRRISVSVFVYNRRRFASKTSRQRWRGIERGREGGNSGGDGVAATPEPAQRSRKHAKTVFQNCRNSQWHGAGPVQLLQPSETGTGCAYGDKLWQNIRCHPPPENFKSRGYTAIARNFLPSTSPSYYLDNNDLLSFV